MNEQDILFKIQYSDTVELMEEVYYHISTKSRRIYGSIYFIGAVFFLFAVFVLGMKYLFWVFFSLGYLIFILLRHKIAARKYVKRMTEHYDGVMPDQFFHITEDTIYCIQGDSSFKLPIRKLDKATCTRHTLNLYAGKTNRLTIVKDAFTKGTYEEFLQFLRTKCPQLEIPE